MSDMQACQRRIKHPTSNDQHQLIVMVRAVIHAAMRLTIGAGDFIQLK